MEQYKFVSCPICGKKICKVAVGSKIIIGCIKCKAMVLCSVGADGKLTIISHEKQG